MKNDQNKKLEQLIKEVELLKSRLDARERRSHTLEARQQVHIDAGKKPEDITYGMLCEGFQSIGGIPDNFQSAEDPADRITLWNDVQRSRVNRRHSSEYGDDEPHYISSDE